MRVLIWATTLGADLWSLTRWLDARSDVRLRVVMRGAKAFDAQPVARLFPLRARLRERRFWHHLLGAPGFRPDVTVMDNWVPLRAPSPYGLMLWHGFGWKGPNDRVEFASLHAGLRRAWGDPCSPNPSFRWMCFGPSDFEHRTRVSGFHPANCRIVGAPSHDDLRRPLPRTSLAAAYPFDVVGRKTVLFAPTWHYGEVFAHWGTDERLVAALLDRVEALGANAILRLHDRFRYPPDYLAMIERLVAGRRNVVLKSKDRDPDNFLDMQVADVLVTNFSSIANLFYATGRPTVHVYPVRSADEAFLWRTFERGRVAAREVSSVRFVWKFPPEQNGGLLARSFDEVLGQVERALADPECAREPCRAFLREHMLGADGRSCERVWEALVELVEGRSPSVPPPGAPPAAPPSP